eukprot:588982-Amphidinium_carterae.1
MCVTAKHLWHQTALTARQVSDETARKTHTTRRNFMPNLDPGKHSFLSTRCRLLTKRNSRSNRTKRVKRRRPYVGSRRVGSEGLRGAS